MFSCLQILEAFLWFVLITLLYVTLIILTLSVSRLLNLLLRLVAFLLFLNPQCLASISRWITASSSWKRFCLFVCRALSSIMVICMLTAISADCYQYLCVPEYGTANGRLHFHAVHFMRPLRTGSVDPQFGRRVRNRRQVNSLQNTWPYGYSMPIAVRYPQDAFSRSGWLWPVDAKGEPLKPTSYMAVGFYVAKYVNKKSDMDLAAKGLEGKEWNNSLKTKLSLLPKKLFRIRMSRNLGMKMLTMTDLSTECLTQLTKLGYDATPFNQILKQNATREMRLRLGKVTVADVLAAQPVTTNLLKFMRASIKMIGVSNLQSFIASMTQKLTLSDISDESKNYLDKAGITTACLRIKSKWTAGGK